MRTLLELSRLIFYGYEEDGNPFGWGPKDTRIVTGVSDRLTDCLEISLGVRVAVSALALSVNQSVAGAIPVYRPELTRTLNVC